MAVDAAASSLDLYLNIGCGLTTPDTWVNIDASWHARLARYPRLRRLLVRVGIGREKLAIPWPANVQFHNVRNALPYATCSVAGICGSHVL